ncbi:MAG: hypothetical protein JWO38_984 [Gemmataceae bacterium]|nr:hypothetical protein [Gemmataceae bacterium]
MQDRVIGHPGGQDRIEINDHHRAGRWVATLSEDVVEGVSRVGLQPNRAEREVGQGFGQLADQGVPVRNPVDHGDEEREAVLHPETVPESPQAIGDPVRRVRDGQER